MTEGTIQGQAARRRLFDRNTPAAMLLGVTAGLAVISLLGLMTFLGAVGYYHLYGLILPGVHSGAVSLGGMTEAEASDALSSAWSSPTALTLQAGDQAYAASLADFGLVADPAATAARAASIGRSEGPLSAVYDFIDVALNGEEVPPVVGVDVDAARTGLTRWAETLNQPALNAGLRFEGGEVIGVPGQSGVALDVEATLAELIADPARPIQLAYMPLHMATQAPAIAEPGEALNLAESLLAEPLALRLYDPITGEWTERSVGPDILASWLSVTEAPGGLSLAADPVRISTYLESLGTELGAPRYIDPEEGAAAISAALEMRQPATLILRREATTYTVAFGDSLTAIAWRTGMPYWRILEANPGLEANGLDVGQEITIPSLDVLMPFPIVPEKRLLVDMSEQRLYIYENGAEIGREVISTGIDRSPTQPGVFQVQTFDEYAYASVWDLYMPHFIGIYEAWPGFMNGFHGLPTLSNGNILWADVLGRPASYGCIILNLEAAGELYAWAEQGVVVEIRE